MSAVQTNLGLSPLDRDLLSRAAEIKGWTKKVAVSRAIRNLIQSDPELAPLRGEIADAVATPSEVRTASDIVSTPAK